MELRGNDSVGKPQTDRFRIKEELRFGINFFDTKW